MVTEKILYAFVIKKYSAYFYSLCDREVYKNPTVLYLTGERSTALLLRSETKQGCLLPKLLFNIKLEFSKARKSNSIHIGKEEIKHFYSWMKWFSI